MTVESGVFSLLAEDADLAVAMGVPADQLSGRIKRTGAAIDISSPFLIIRWEESPLFGNLGVLGFTLRAHDRDKTYDRIGQMLEAAKRRLTAVVHERGITQVDWKGRSADLVDDGYKTLTRYDTYVAAAGLATREEV